MNSASTIKDFFTIDEARHLSGLSVAMLDYLCRNKLAVPTYSQRRGRGRPRQYSFGDVVLLRALARLLSAGVSVLRLRRSLHALRRLHPDITPTNLPASHLVTDGARVYLRERDDVLEELESGQLAFVFVIELSRIKDEVLKRLDVQVADGSDGGFHYQLRRACG